MFDSSITSFLVPMATLGEAAQKTCMSIQFWREEIRYGLKALAFGRAIRISCPALAEWISKGEITGNAERQPWERLRNSTRRKLNRAFGKLKRIAARADDPAYLNERLRLIPTLVPIGELAEETGLSDQFWLAAIRKGLKAYQLGISVRIDCAGLRDWLSKNGIDGVVKKKKKEPSHQTISEETLLTS